MIRIIFNIFKACIFKHFLKLIITFLVIIKFDSSFASCFNYIPYAHNQLYTHLPASTKFCVKLKDKKIYYNISKNFSRKIYNNFDKDSEIYAFGDSQFLGIDWDEKSLKKHDLERITNSKKISIFAAPNNGPFQVTNLINSLNEIIVKNINLKKIILSFNYGNDVFRLQKKWKLQNFVPLKSDELSNIMSQPFLYDLILLRGLLTGKYFSVNLPDNKKTFLLFSNLDDTEINKRLVLWLNKIKKIKNTIRKELNIIIYPPYWGFDLSKKDKIYVNNKFLKLICNIQKEKIFDEIILGKTNLDINFTEDKRHFATGYLKYEKKIDDCK